MLVFEERGNQSTRRKPLCAEKRTNKLNPHMTPSLGIEPGPHWWEASALTTAPPLHPILLEWYSNHFSALFCPFIPHSSYLQIPAPCNNYSYIPSTRAVLHSVTTRVTLSLPYCTFCTIEHSCPGRTSPKLVLRAFSWAATMRASLADSKLQLHQYLLILTPLEIVPKFFQSMIFLIFF